MKKEKNSAEEKTKEAVDIRKTVQQAESVEDERERQDEEIWRMLEMSNQMYKGNTIS